MTGKERIPRLGTVGEEGILRFLRRRHGSLPGGVRLGIGDDAALLDLPSGSGLLVTTDLMIEDVHFRRRDTSPEALGCKLLAVNVSDIAAMGGRPLFALLSFALPPDLKYDFLRRFSAGLRKGGRKYGVALVGGDTTSSAGGIFTCLTLLGRLAGSRPLLRSSARPGDHLYVTGHLGASTLGLAALGLEEPERSSPHLRGVIRKHLWPAPPAALGAALGEVGFSGAVMDLSDGLSTDLTRLCRESGVGAEVSSAALPILPGTRKAASTLGSNAVEAALHGGEEYELLLTARPASAGALEECASRLGVRVTRIGTILRERRVEQVGPGGVRSPLTPEGWQHF